jgi:hypothetical protein
MRLFRIRDASCLAGGQSHRRFSVTRTTTAAAAANAVPVLHQIDPGNERPHPADVTHVINDRHLASLGAALVSAGLAVTLAAPASASPPPPSPFQGSLEVGYSVSGSASGSAVTAPQYFEIEQVDHFSPFAYYPTGGPTTWQLVRRLGSLAEGGATTAKYVVIGAPLPDEFWLGFDGASGHVGVDRRPYTAPNISPGLETLTLVPGTYVVAGPQLGVPGVPGTMSVAITLPTPIPALS